MKFNDIVDLSVSILRANPAQSIYIEGAPGNGKTSAASVIFDRLGIPKENQVVFRPSLHDPVDLIGVPSVSDGTTAFNPAAWLHQMQEGAWGLCIDELPQGTVMMQNALAGLMLDRLIGDVKLSDNVYVVATGNRTKDKAGASRTVSQLANRVMRCEMESSLDDWTDWALTEGLPVWLIAGLRFRPNLLNDFNPDRFSNPTERTWEMVGKLPETLNDSQMFHAMQGLVGEAAAAEMAGFKQIMDKLPNIDVLLLRPRDAEVPTDPATLFALSGALAHRASVDNFESLLVYGNRIPPEFQVLIVKDAVKLCPAVCNTSAFIAWASKNAGVVI